MRAQPFLHLHVIFITQTQPDKFKPEPSNSDAKNEKLAKKHNDRFVKVSLAYDVLSDEKKKNAYDKYGQNGLDMLEKGINPEEAGFGGGGFGGAGMGGGFGGGDAFKMFEQMVSKSLTSSFCLMVIIYFSRLYVCCVYI